MARFDKFSIWVILGLLFFAISAHASPAFNVPIQITSNPGEDFAPTISPDGKFMVYVSDKSGNLDLWLKHLGAGIQPPDQRLTFHSAEDGSPEISPDGNMLAFVSHRSDPRGDIYILDLSKKGLPVPIIQQPGEDRDPVWSSDQTALYFSSRSSSTPVIEKIVLQGLERTELLRPGGVNLSLSPDGKHLAFVTGETHSDMKVYRFADASTQVLEQGPFIDISPRWSVDGKLLLFTRYQYDTNHDGQVGIDDNADIWSVEFNAGSQGRFRQLTDSSTYDFLPASLSETSILFTSHHEGGSDIWQVPLVGIMPTLQDQNKGLITESCNPHRANYLCVLLLKNQTISQNEGRAKNRYRLALQYIGLKHDDLADSLFQQILDEKSGGKEIQGLSEIELLRGAKTIDKLQKISADYAGTPAVEARAYLEMGNRFLDLGEPDQALKFFQKVIRQYSKEREISAQAAFSQSHIYRLVGNRDKLVESFLQGVQDYPDVNYWKQKSIEAILQLYEDQPTLEKKVSSLQVLAKRPLLSAIVQNRIGELYHQSAENLLAKEAYQKTLTKKDPDASFKARLALAEIYAEEENFAKSLSLYREMPEGLAQPYIESARAGQIQKLLEKGNWELRVGEVKLAVKTFRRLMTFSPQTIKAHRGYLQASAALGKSSQAVKFYRDRLQSKKDAVDHYALGLALTYLNPPSLDEAEVEMGKALAKNAQEVFFHQTLGWIYEQKEREGTGFIEKALHAYQIALSLNGDEDSRNQADLFLNLGNGHYSLNNSQAAYHYYQKREGSQEPFLNADREAVYRQRFGSVAFKSGHTRVAITQFEKALQIEQKKDAFDRMAELHDRIALAYQDQGDYAQAVEHFSKTFDLNRKTGNEASYSRTLRNIANNIYSENQKVQDSEAMSHALNHYFQAIEKLEQYGAVERKKKSSALIDVNVDVGLGEDVSSAAHGFDKQGEMKLIFHYIGQIYGDLGQYEKAIEYFKKKLSLIPSGLDVDKNIPVLLEKALLLNQIGNYYYQSVDYPSSLEFFKKSFDLSQKLNNRRGMAVNAANIGRIVITLSSQKPLVALQDDILHAIKLLEKAVEAEAISEPELLVVLHNYLGIFYHFKGFHLDADVTSPNGNAPELQFQSSLKGLQAQWQSIHSALQNFELAMDFGSQKNPNRQAVWQNLNWTRYLAGFKQRERTPSVKNRWQFLYSQAMKKEGPERLELLLQAEKELSRLPYGWLGRSLLTSVERLYEEITFDLFQQQKFTLALEFSEKGKKQVQIVLAPKLQFSDEDRQAYFDEIITYGELLKSVSGEEASALLDEYEEFLQLAGEDDPELVSWVAPQVPALGEVQSYLTSRQRLLKFQRVHNDVLVWRVQENEVAAKRISGNPKLFDLVSRATEHGLMAEGVAQLSEYLLAPWDESLGQEVDAVVLIADGKLEFLPWAAMKWGQKPLLETTTLSFVSSLSQWQRSIKLKNLYKSRLLVLDAEQSENYKKSFTTVFNLHGDDANLKKFSQNWAHFGVVQVESLVRLDRLNPQSSYITLSRKANRFQRVPLSALYEKPFESYLMVMADVEHEFDPLLAHSSTSLLLEGLVFKGYPGVLLHTGKIAEPLHQELMTHFMANLKKKNPAESLRMAQQVLSQKYPESLEWAQYRYYGFPGMNSAEQKVFAEQHFQSNLQKGAKAFREKDWLSVMDYLEKALVLQSFLPEKQMATKVYTTLAQAAYNNRDYPKAIRYQNEVRALSEKDPEVLAEAFYFLGILYSRTEQYDLAVDHLKKALKIYEENDILDRLAEGYSTLGNVEENALDYDKALEAFNASLMLNDEMGEDLQRGRELRRIGRIYYLRLNRFKEARDAFSQAYELFKEVGQVDQQVESLLELGLVAEKEGDFKQALEFYVESQKLAETAHLKPGLAKAFLYQANSHWFQGNYQQAFRFQRQSLSLAKELGDTLQQTFTLNTLGLIHWTLNDPGRALEHLEKSLELAQTSNSQLDVATAYNNMGLVHRKEKRYPKSIEFFKKALQMDEQLKSKWGQGYTHRNLGMSYLRMGQLPTAETHLKKAVNLSRKIGNRTNQVKAMLELGHLALERKQWEPAVALFRETLVLSERINVKEVSWRALRGEGLALIQLGKKDSAVEAYKKSVAVVDDLRAAIKVEEFQNGFLTDKQDVYQELILLLLDLDKVEESFQFAERAKSRSFIDLLGNQKISLKNDVSKSLYEALQKQKQDIRKSEELLMIARNKGEGIASLAETLVKARTRYQDLLISAKEQSPEISNFVTVEAISLPDLQSLLDDSVALVEYLVTEKELVAWVVTKTNVEVARVALEEKQLNDFIADYRERIQKLAPVAEQAQKLYALLIQPVEKFISGKRFLGIIPHAHLHYISFSSLKSEQGYLIEKHPLFYSPSASVMQFTFKKQAIRNKEIKVLAMGNPDLGDFNYDLPLAEMEAQAMKWDFPTVDILTREKATEGWLQEHISEYQIIHIASHGEFDSVNPLFSSLKLTRSSSADGNFEVNEVFGLEINADIVTLSACQTGLGDIVGGDELVGLNRAFIYAGTKSILSSLWRVSDISTAVLVKHFYRNYSHENKAESLRKAQLRVKRLYPHPSYWAGFSLAGDYR
ncbi:MAG: CHAT domain-containing protein [Nitrospinaceae bacterium]|nr:CHAT domain-containing protein [Nitrospinaceae bacterium]